MIEQLFGSKTRVKLLRLFYSNPNRSFYVREITRKIDEQINSVRRELGNLLSIGLISSDTNNNRLYYEVNQAYEFYKPLSNIFGGVVATDESVVKDESDTKPNPLKTLGNIDIAIYTGKFTRDDRSGVDVVMVGDINKSKLEKYMADLEAEEGHELRYTVMPVKEFTYRLQVNDKFISSILMSKKQILIDKNNVLKTNKA